jgi:hypothetical protein
MLQKLSKSIISEPEDVESWAFLKEIGTLHFKINQILSQDIMAIKNKLLK